MLAGMISLADVDTCVGEVAGFPQDALDRKAALIHVLRYGRLIMDNRIAAIRIAQGLSRSELARRVRTTPAQIQKLEDTDRRLTLDWMRRIANALGVKPSELLLANDVRSPEMDKGELSAAIAQFPAEDRFAAQHLAAQILGLILQFQQSSGQAVVGARAGGNPTLSPSQKDLARMLVQLSRSLAGSLAEEGPGGVRVSRRTSR